MIISTGLLSKNRHYHNSESYLVEEVQNGMILTVIVLVFLKLRFYCFYKKNKKIRTPFVTNVFKTFVIQF